MIKPQNMVKIGSTVSESQRESLAMGQFAFPPPLPVQMFYKTFGNQLLSFTSPYTLTFEYQIIKAIIYGL